MVDFVVVMQSLEKFKSQFYGFSLSNSKSALTISRDWNIFSPFLFLSGSFLHKKRLASWLIPSRKLQSWKWESSPFLAETRSGNRVVFSKNFKPIKILKTHAQFSIYNANHYICMFTIISFCVQSKQPVHCLKPDYSKIYCNCILLSHDDVHWNLLLINLWIKAVFHSITLNYYLLGQDHPN